MRAETAPATPALVEGERGWRARMMGEREREADTAMRSGGASRRPSGGRDGVRSTFEAGE
jgi:hypothetical protein